MSEAGCVPFSLAGRRVWVAGHRGMVGSAVVRRLAHEDCEVVTAPHQDLDLRCQEAVFRWVADTRPEVVVVAAAKVGGIHANSTQPAAFLYDNLVMETNIIEAARQAGVAKLLFLGSTCIYPRLAPQPIPESALLTGPLEPTNQWYALAKIAGIQLCQAYRRQYGCDFISAMPTNLYGPNDNFHSQNSHVLPALMRRVHEAKRDHAPSMTVWGTGAPLREFLYVDDLADALVHLLKVYSGESHVNVGTGREVSIRQLAKTLCRVIGYPGKLEFDASKPDGTPRKLCDVSLLSSLGWTARTDLESGIIKTYQWFLSTDQRCRTGL